MSRGTSRKDIPEDAPEDVKSFMVRNGSTWATKTDQFGMTRTYFSTKFKMPEDGVLTPTVQEPGGLA